MKKIFTCTLVLVALTLTSCVENLKEISKQEFVDASKTLKAHDFTKAVAVYSHTRESTLGKNNERYECYLNYANNIWTPVEQTNDDIAYIVVSTIEITMQKTLQHVDELPDNTKFYQFYDSYKLEYDPLMYGAKTNVTMSFNLYGLPIELYELMDMSSEGVTMKEELKLSFTYSK